MSLTKDMPKEYKSQVTMKPVAISDRGSLVSGGRRMSASDPGKARRRGSRGAPSPSPSPPPPELGFLYLENEWTFWFDEKALRGMNCQDYNSQLKQLGSFNSVQGFWRYWNNMIDPSKFPNDSNLRLFKRGIKPMWEDPANINGGRWVIACKKSDTSQMFMNLMLCLIGEQFKYSDDMCGLVLSVRAKGDSISIWNRDGTNQTVINEAPVTFLPILHSSGMTEKSISYRKHVKAVELNKAAAEKGFRRRASSSNIATGYSGLKDGRHKLTASTTNLRSLVHSSEHALLCSPKQPTSSDDELVGDEKKVSWQDGDDSGLGEFKDTEDFPSDDDCCSDGGSSEVPKKSSSFSTSPFSTPPQWKKHRKTVSDSSHKRKIQFERAPSPGNVTPPNGAAAGSSTAPATTGNDVASAVVSALQTSTAAAAAGRSGGGHARHRSLSSSTSANSARGGHRKSSSAEETSSSSTLSVARKVNNANRVMHDTQAPRPQVPGASEANGKNFASAPTAPPVKLGDGGVYVQVNNATAVVRLSPPAANGSKAQQRHGGVSGIGHKAGGGAEVLASKSGVSGSKAVSELLGSGAMRSVMLVVLLLLVTAFAMLYRGGAVYDPLHVM